MATLSVKNLEKHSGVKTIKFANGDNTSKKSSVTSGASKATNVKPKGTIATQNGFYANGGKIKQGNGSSIVAFSMMRRKLTQFRTNKLFNWSMRHSEPLQKENTFQLNPESDSRFCAGRVQALMEEILEDMLQNQTRYDAKVCSTMSQCISDTIKARVKSLGYDRYKLVVHVMMAQDTSQGLEVASRSVWDNERDNYATAMYRSGDLVVIANVFGTYFE